MVHTLDPSILREYDIRGKYQQTLFEEDAYFIGKSFGTYLQKMQAKKVTVGRDGRLSSPDLQSALIRGLVETGCEVINIGVGPSPLLYFSVYELSADAGIMVTGSHNPPEYNGFKFMVGPESFWGENIKKLGQRIENADFIQGVGTISEADIEDSYIKHLLSEAPQSLSLKIAWDAGNGASGEILQKLVEHLPGEHHLLFADIDGTFPNHHPDPTIPKYLEKLKDYIIEHQCDFGIAFDGDGDRIGIMDSQGNLFHGDQLLSLLARDVLSEAPKGSKIVADVKSSQYLFDVISDKEGTPIMWKSGHSLIRSKMRSEEAVLAGEMSGHIFYNDRNPGYDDAIYAAMRLLKAIEKHQWNITDLYKEFPSSFHTPEIRFECDDTKKFSIVEDVKAELSQTLNAHDEVIDIDGIRFQSNDGWWLLRASNTENLLVARCEGKSEAGLQKLKKQLSDLLVNQQIEPPKELVENA